jgi:hypothetical protein
MIRYMPETRKYLLQNMSAFELIGYNKVADNTFVNIVPNILDTNCALSFTNV